MTLQEENDKLKRQVDALQKTLKSIYSLKGKEISSPLYSLHPSYYQMITVSALVNNDLNDNEVIDFVEKKLKIHNDFITQK